MGHTCSQQPDRGKLFGLSQLVFQAHALGEVVEDQQASEHLPVFAEQRSGRDVDGELPAGRGLEPEFIERERGVRPGSLWQLRHEFGREDGLQPFSHHL